MPHKTQWTPGPWRISGGSCVYGADPERKEICQVDGGPERNLIAAAPELYEALELLVIDNEARAMAGAEVNWAAILHARAVLRSARWP